MAFTLRGEIDIDGRKGIAVLRQVQGEAIKTTKAFEQGSRTNAHFAKMLLGINSQAAATHKALFLLARTSGVGLFGVAAVKAGIDFGETLMQIGQEAESAGKSLDKTFRAGLKATTAEGVQSSIESITEQIEKLRAKTEGFSLRRMLGKGLEKLTGIDFGLTPEEGLISAGEKELELLKKRLEARKALEEAVKAESERAEKRIVAISRLEQEYKLEKAIGGEMAKIRAMMGGEEFLAAQRNLEYENERLSSLEEYLTTLKSIKGIERDDSAIKKTSLDIEKQRVEVIKAQTQYINAQRKEEFSVLAGGGTAGRSALAGAQRRKAAQAKQEGFKREESAVKARQEIENKKRAEQGLPPLNQADIRNIMAEEAVGLREVKAPQGLPSATGGGSEGKTTGKKAEISVADVMKDLLKEFKSLADTIKTAPIVTSAAGSV